MKLQITFLLTCRPKRYQKEPTTWPDSIKMRRFMMKFAQADSKMNPVGDWPISRGRNLNNLGKYCTRIAARRRFLA